MGQSSSSSAFWWKGGREGWIGTRAQTHMPVHAQDTYTFIRIHTYTLDDAACKTHCTQTRTQKFYFSVYTPMFVHEVHDMCAQTQHTHAYLCASVGLPIIIM